MKRIREKREVLSVVLILALVLTTVFSGIAGDVKSVNADAIGVSGGGSLEKATKINADTEYIDSISEAGEEDWYCFTTPNYDSYVELYVYNQSAGNSSYFEAGVYTQYNEEKIRTNVLIYGTKTVYCKLIKNTTYFLRFHITANYTGFYKFKVTFNRDDDGDTMSEATSVSVGRKYECTFASTSDKDWFSVTVPTSTNYTVSLKNNDTKNSSLALYTKTSETILSLSVANANSEASKEVSLTAGQTYYVCCSASNIGNYSFSIIDLKAVTPGPTKSPSPSITPGPIYTPTPSATLKPDAPMDEINIEGGSDIYCAVEIEGWTNYRAYFDGDESGDWYCFMSPFDVSLTWAYISIYKSIPNDNQIVVELYEENVDVPLHEFRESKFNESEMISFPNILLESNTLYYLRIYEQDDSNFSSGFYGFQFIFYEPEPLEPEPASPTWNPSEDEGDSGTDKTPVPSPSVSPTPSASVKPSPSASAKPFQSAEPSASVRPAQSSAPVASEAPEDDWKKNSKTSYVIVKEKKRAVTVKWGKVADAQGYQLVYSTSKSMKKKKSKIAFGNQVTITNLKRKKTYYIRIRAYNVIDNKKVYGKWSKKIKAKVK